MSIDGTILDFFVSNRESWLTFVMLIITYSSGYMVVYIITSLSIISFSLHRHTNKILPLLVSILGSSGTIYILKEIIDKARPPIEKAVYLESTGSMPSGHAGMAVALYGFFLCLAWKHDKHHLKNTLIIFLAILIILVGLSRLYLGVHYFTDIIAGYIVGSMWVFIALKSNKKYESC